MKKFIAMILCCAVVFCLFSCTKISDKEGGDTSESTENEDSKNVQTYDELEYKSDDRFTDEELFTFTYSDGTFTCETEQIVSIFEERFGICMGFKSTEAKQYANVCTPFGVTAGHSLDVLIEKHSLDTGFAAYVKKGGAFVMYDAEKEVDISDGEGGCMYFGYAKDASGKWAFMDYTMLTQVIEGKLVVQGAEGDYDVVIYSCIVDDAKNITKITQLYGEISAVMDVING